MIERGILSHQCLLRTAHGGRRVGVLDIELLVGGELALMAMPTQIPRPCNFHRAQSRHYAARAEFAVARLLPAGTRKTALGVAWLAEVQQPAEGGCAGMMQIGAEGHLHGLRSANMRATSVATSRAISFWIASAVFFPPA